MKSVLFDLDGTLADTESLKAHALAEAVSHFGKSVSPEIYKTVMGESWETVTKRFFADAKINPTLEQFDPIFRKHYSQLIETKALKNTATYDFIANLKARGFQLAVVSSAALWMVEKILHKTELQKFFEVIVSGDEVQHHKPNPEAYLRGLEKLEISPDQAVAFEDSQAGFQAATGAGMKVFGLHHAFNEKHDFGLCTGTLRSFAECESWDLFRQPC